MSAPSSYDRVLAALRGLFPAPVTITRPGGAAPAAGDSMVGRELGTLAWVAARVVDRFDAMAAELFPDGAVETLTRWETVARTATNAALSTAARQARVLSTLRRANGVQLSRLAAALYSVLGLASADQVQFIEPLRAQIDAALTLEMVSGRAIPTTAPALTLSMGAPWPGVVDDTGVLVYLEFSAFGTPVATLTSPKGTVWNIQPSQAAGDYETRTVFLGETAAGLWTLAVTDASGGKTLTSWSLRVSNDVDAGQIYNFFCFRDLALGGTTPDVAEAQRLFDRTVLGHMNPSVITSEEFIHDLGSHDTEPEGVA